MRQFPLGILKDTVDVILEMCEFAHDTIRALVILREYLFEVWQESTNLVEQVGLGAAVRTHREGLKRLL